MLGLGLGFGLGLGLELGLGGVRVSIYVLAQVFMLKVTYSSNKSRGPL